MMKLENFVGMMTGHFDNKDQFNKMQAEGKIYPYAEHVNTICNDKINNLPEDFKGKFVVEESYYCLLYTSPSPRDYAASRMPSAA